MRAVAIIDGEHYAPVVRDALGALPYDFVAAVLVGGSEKLRGGEDYGLPLAPTLEAAVAAHDPEVVVDLSDEPVLGPRERFLLASRALAAGLPYIGPDFRFDPPQLEAFPLPSLSVVGTGKRVGKTAVCTHVARVLSAELDVVIVAMGRGGPPEPEVAEAPPSVSDLLALSRQGRHAASDHLEDAALAGVVAVGCRRCGGGLAGAPAVSNVRAGAAVAAAMEPDLVLFEGSGAALPPVATGQRILVVSALQKPEIAAGYLNAYRILVSDLVVLTMAEAGSGHERVRAAIREVKDVPIVAVVLRPRPVRPVAGRAAYFTTAPEEARERLADHLRTAHGVDVVRVSSALAHRERLRAELEAIEADAYLIELKAAAIDVVAEAAAQRGAEVVPIENEVLPLPSEPDLDGQLRALAEAARDERLASLAERGDNGSHR